MFPFSFLKGGAANTARTQAFLTATGITDATIISALNAMDNSLISAGLLPAGTGAGKIKVLYPFVGGTAATHKFNFVDPRDLDVAFRLVFFGGWVHSANGILGNGGNTYADTFLNPFTELSLTSSHLSIYVINNSNVGTPYDIGNADDAGIAVRPTFLISRYSSNLAYFGIADAGYSTNNASLDSRAFWLGSTNGSRTQDFYKNGVLFASGAGVNAYSDRNLYLGAANAGGTAGFFSDKQFAACSFGEGLSSTEQANYYNSIQTFQTTLGRQV
jgi:hypothetical protein